MYTTIMALQRRRVVIVGGGYAGVRVAHELATRVGSAVEIMMVAPAAVHLDTPLLYEVASLYPPTDIETIREMVTARVTVPLSEIMQQLPVGIIDDVVTNLQPRERLLTLRSGRSLSFDWLVLAVGTHVSTLGVPGVKDHSFSVLTLTEALRLRHQVMRCVLTAAHHPRGQKEQWQTIVVVGGGSTGVETAAELAGLLRKVGQERGFAVADYRIIVVEAVDHLMANLAPAMEARVRSELTRRGIEIRLRTKVTTVAHDHVVLDDGNHISTRTVVWSAGLGPHPLFARSGLITLSRGVRVSEYLTIPEYPYIFAAGDCAQITGTKLPAVIPVAYQQAVTVAKNIARAVAGETSEPFVYTPTGGIVTLGGKRAVLVFAGGWGLIGFIPWVVKRLISLRYWLQYLPLSRAFHYWWAGVRLYNRND